MQCFPVSWKFLKDSHTHGTLVVFKWTFCLPPTSMTEYHNVETDMPGLMWLYRFKCCGGHFILWKLDKKIKSDGGWGANEGKVYSFTLCQTHDSTSLIYLLFSSLRTVTAPAGRRGSCQNCAVLLKRQDKSLFLYS